MLSAEERRKNRRLSQSEKRALAWLNEKEREVVQSKAGAGMPRSLGAFTVHRLVLGSTPGGLFDNEDFLYLLDSDHGAKRFPKLLTSLITPREARNATDPWNDKAPTICKQLEDTASRFPVTLSGFIAGVTIVGARKNKPGPRFISLTLSGELSDELSAEREQLLDRAHMVPRHRTRLAHVALLETTNQLLAEDLKNRVRSLGLDHAPIEFGETDVVPIPNQDNYYRQAARDVLFSQRSLEAA